MSHSALLLDSVIQRIFHQRLQRQLWDAAGGKLRINRDLIRQNILVTHLLDLQVTPHMLLFLPQCR